MTLYNPDIYELLETLKWPLVGTWSLPDQSEARLWRNPAAERETQKRSNVLTF
jgi:hypothetical protein